MGHLWQLDHVHNLLLKTLLETEVLFAFRVNSDNRFRLKESRSVLPTELRSESKAEIPLVVRGLQKYACHLDKIYYQEESKKWLLTM